MSGFQNDPGTVQQEAGFGFNGRFWTESFNDGMTALAGGALAGATKIDSMFCRFSTVASIGDSAVLPPAVGGVGSGALIVCVINDAVNAMLIYGQASDTINGQVGATGVTQMGKSVVYYQCSQNGKWIAQGLGTGYGQGNSAAFPLFSTQNGITASSTQTQAAGTPITASQAQISVCAVSGNAVTLPPAQAGMEITVINNGAQPCNVFPASQAGGGVSGGDKINALAQNAAFSLVASTPTIFYCFVAGTWITK
jgi:hypothetical protein